MEREREGERERKRTHHLCMSVFCLGQTPPLRAPEQHLATQGGWWNGAQTPAGRTPDARGRGQEGQAVAQGNSLCNWSLRTIFVYWGPSDRSRYLVVWLSPLVFTWMGVSWVNLRFLHTRALCADQSIHTPLFCIHSWNWRSFGLTRTPPSIFTGMGARKQRNKALTLAHAQTIHYTSN